MAAKRVAVLSTLVAGVAYAWGLGENPAHYVYAAAVRSMSAGWHNFFYAAYDSQGFMSIDKAPGALWVQALSVRVFGYETWAMLLPNVVAGAATVAVVFAAVRRWAGPTPAALASVVLALTPITVAADRVNLPDGLLALALVGAVYTFWRALEQGSLRWLVLTAVIIAVGFQIKTVVALAIVPVLGLVYLVAAPGGVGRRVAHLAVTGLITAAGSSVWMLLIALTPADQRPYVDGSTTNSVWQMVWGYNFLDRADATAPTGGGLDLPVLRDGQVLPLDQGGRGGLLRLFNDQVGGQISWLLPLSAILLVAGLVLAWRGPRTDRLRAGWLVWGGWLVVYGLALSLSRDIHPYYTLLLAPSVAAVVGTGLFQAWTNWATRGAWWVLPIGVLATGAWAFVLFDRSPDYLPWLRPVVAGSTALAVVALVLRRRGGAARLAPVAGVLTAVAVLAGPVAWVAPVFNPPTDPRTAMFQNFNPLAGPDPNAMTTGVDLQGLITKASADPAAVPTTLPPAAVLAAMPGFPDPKLVQFLMTHRNGEKFAVATVGGTGASPYVRMGMDVMELGGFAGTMPYPTRDQLADFVQRGDVRYVLFGGFSYDSPTSLTRKDWIVTHCARVRPADYTDNPWMGFTSALFDCRAGD